MSTRRRPWVRGLALAAVLAAGVAAPVASAQPMISTGGDAFTLHVTSLRDMPFRTVVRQQYDYSCGSAALATLLRFHYGRPLNEAQVFSAMYAVGDQPKIRQVGFSLLDMKTYLASIGLAADGYKQNLDGLRASVVPAIAVVKIGAYRHFVVIKGVVGDQVLVGDPALGLKMYSAKDFQAIWSGVVFLIHEQGSQVARYNQISEWSTLTHAPNQPLDNASLASFTRGMPPLYQISPMRSVGQ